MNKVYLLQEKDFEGLLRRIESLETGLKNLLNETMPNDWVDSKEVCKVLDVSTRTLQNYRDNGKISFCQKGRIIRYRRKDVEQFMMDGYQNPFSKRWRSQ